MCIITAMSAGCVSVRAELCHAASSPPCKFVVSVRYISNACFLLLAQCIYAVGQRQQALVDVCTVTQLLASIVCLSSSLTAGQVHQCEFANQNVRSVLVARPSSDYNFKHLWGKGATMKAHPMHCDQRCSACSSSEHPDHVLKLKSSDVKVSDQSTLVGTQEHASIRECVWP